MVTETQGWMKSLEQSGCIESFDTGFGVYHRLTAGGVMNIPSSIVKKLQDAYDPGLEKGGFFFVLPERKEGKTILTVQSVCFISNVSDYPEGRYQMNREEFVAAYYQAEAEKLLPFKFHTHPTRTDNYLESLLFLQQMDTSAPDKSASLFCLNYEDCKLRLPDVLVIGNAASGRDLFIGLYGGLVAPLDFTDRKNDLKKQFQDKVTNGVGDWLDTPGKQFAAAASALTALFLLIRYPKAILPTALVAGTVLPVIAYRSTKDHEHFAVTGSRQSLEIALPKIDDAMIRENEKQIVELSEKLRKQRQQSAAA